MGWEGGRELGFKRSLGLCGVAVQRASPHLQAVAGLKRHSGKGWQLAGLAVCVPGPGGKGWCFSQALQGRRGGENYPSLPTEELHTSLTDAPGQGWPWHTFISMGRLILPPPMSQQLQPQPQPGSGVTAWGSQSHQCSAWSLGASADCGNIPK